jgi:signal transduction histidine kinase
MISRRAIRVALAVIGLIEGLGAYTLVLASDHESTSKAVFFLFVLLGWAFIGSGLVASIRRPDSRFGWLLAGVGFAWFLNALTEANAAVPFTAGHFLGSLWIAIFVHAVLVYPDGRLERRLAKASAVLVYVICTVIQFFGVLWHDPRREMAECAGGACPKNLALVSANHDLYAATGAVQNALGALVALGALIVLIRRWRHASGPLRRALAPVFVSGGVYMVGFVVLLLLDLTVGVRDEVAAGFLLVMFATVPIAFLGGVLRGRLAHGSVSRLVVELGAAEPGGLRDALARTLRDPSLELAYWLPETGSYVDAAGHPVAVEDGPGRAVTIVEHAGSPVAAVIHDPSLNESPTLVRSACAAAGIALANERLQADLRARLEELRASRARIVEAGDAERRRLERNLHDGAQQRLVALSVALRLARSKLASDPTEADRVLREAESELSEALAELRELARGIHPAALDRGLEPALRALTAREPLPAELNFRLTDRLPRPVEAAAYYVVAEALTNVAKYANASCAQVDVSGVDGTAVVRVIDDGVGGADVSRGSGLRGLRDRVEALDGRLRIESPSGGGTEVVAEIPIAMGPG